jgi:radical S-adenosyl methionine domain-containing protein 2
LNQSVNGNTGGIVMSVKQLVVNLHLSETCNFRCKHCFAHFKTGNVLRLDGWQAIINNIIKRTPILRFNLAGGEPTLYPELNELISFIAGKGIKVSIITNGFLLSEESIRDYRGRVSMIGLSIDSCDPHTLQNLGRCTKAGGILDRDRAIMLCRVIKEAGIRLKINTVVSKLNFQEDNTAFIKNVRPDRFKILKMKVFKHGRFNNSRLAITDQEFAQYCSKFSKAGISYIPEDDLRDAYMMVDASGNLVSNHGDSYQIIANLLQDDFSESLSKLPLNWTLYDSRY